MVLAASVPSAIFRCAPSMPGTAPEMHRSARNTVLVSPCLIFLLASGGGCAPTPPEPEEPAVEVAESPRYAREFAFVGQREGESISLLFSFAASTEQGATHRRSRGWVGHGAGWEQFLDAEATTEDGGAVWRIVPTQELRVMVGGPAEIEALAFRRPDRALRLEVDGVRSGWTTFRHSRFRMLDGRLRLGPGWVDGVVLEVQRFLPRPAEGEEASWVLLSDGGETQMVVAEMRAGDGPPERLAWTLFGDEERTWEGFALRARDTFAFDEARRDIPGGWEIVIPEARIRATAGTDALDPVAGEERRGRRAVDARYVLSGQAEMAEEVAILFGIGRYVAR